MIPWPRRTSCARLPGWSRCLTRTILRGERESVGPSSILATMLELEAWKKYNTLTFTPRARTAPARANATVLSEIVARLDQPS